MKYTLDDVREAWDKFNSLGPTDPGDLTKRFNLREAAWKEYTHVRDMYLFDTGVINKHQFHAKWHLEVKEELPN